MIDPRAVVDPSARIAESAAIGPFSVIGAEVEIGEGCRIGPHVVIRGPAVIGRNNRIFQFASIGEEPQDKKFKPGDVTRLVIGDDNTIREGVTIHRGTVQDRGETRIGDDNWIMAYVHVAHDCVIGSHTVLANNATFAGHVTIEDYAGLGGYTLVHQFCRIGAHAYTGGGARITGDLPPFILAEGHPARPRGVNSEGLKRRGYSAEDIAAIKDAYKILYLSGQVLSDVKASLAELARTSAPVAQMLEFIENAKRPLLR